MTVHQRVVCRLAERQQKGKRDHRALPLQIPPMAQGEDAPGEGHANNKAFPDITDDIWVKVASHMRGAPVLELPTTDADFGPEEEVTTSAPRKGGRKSGKIGTADTTVLQKITWPYEVVCTNTVQPTEYEKISVTLFVIGFQIMMASEKENVRPFMLQHLQVLMEDTAL